MERKSEFVMFVLLVGISRDICNESRDSQQLADLASRVPANRIPPNARAAAMVFMRYADGKTHTPPAWMASPKAKRPVQG